MRLLMSVSTAALLLGFVLQFGLGQAQAFTSKPRAAPLAKRNMKKKQKPFPAVKGELLVKLSTSALAKSSTSFDEVAASLEKTLGLKTKISIRPLLTSSEFAVLRVSESSFDHARIILEMDSRVAYAEPNYIYHTFDSIDPNDADFKSLWGMKNTGQTDAAGQVGQSGADIHVASVWAEGVIGSRSIRVAVIDTGIDYNHPDLKANVDAASGYNFVSNTNDAKDDQNHGSHCAGTIGAVANNGIGVSGVNWNVTLIPVKFLDENGSGTADAAVQAIQYATKLGVQIMSNSWGGGGYSQAMADAITEAKNNGILFVAAAGNNSSNNDTTPSYPASYPIDNILSVAASDNRDHLASFSNYGKTVHVAAPGVKILSTEKEGGYGVMSGTSMATPHVAGIAALLLSADATLTYADLKTRLIRSCDKVRVLSRKVLCGGRVNVANALHRIYPVATAPLESEWKEVSTVNLESAHPYESGKAISYGIAVPNAKKIRIVFETIDTEAGYDTVGISQKNGDEIESLSGNLNQYVTDYLDGDQAVITLKADGSINNFGFKVGKLQAVY